MQETDAIALLDDVLAPAAPDDPVAMLDAVLARKSPEQWIIDRAKYDAANQSAFSDDASDFPRIVAHAGDEFATEYPELKKAWQQVSPEYLRVYEDYRNAVSILRNPDSEAAQAMSIKYPDPESQARLYTAMQDVAKSEQFQGVLPAKTTGWGMLGARASRGWQKAANAPFDFAAMVAGRLGAKDMAEQSAMEQTAQAMREQRDPAAPEKAGWFTLNTLARGALSGLESAPQMAGSAALAIGTGGSSIVPQVAYWTVQIAPTEYADLKRRGYDDDLAFTGAIASGAIQGYIENRILGPLEALLPPGLASEASNAAATTVRAVIANRVAAAGKEGVEEVLQDAASSAVREVLAKVQKGLDGREIPNEFREDVARSIEQFPEYMAAAGTLMAPGTALAMRQAVANPEQAQAVAQKAANGEPITRRDMPGVLAAEDRQATGAELKAMFDTLAEVIDRQPKSRSEAEAMGKLAEYDAETNRMLNEGLSGAPPEEVRNNFGITSESPTTVSRETTYEATTPPEGPVADVQPPQGASVEEEGQRQAERLLITQSEQSAAPAGGTEAPEAGVPQQAPPPPSVPLVLDEDAPVQAPSGPAEVSVRLGTKAATARAKFANELREFGKLTQTKLFANPADPELLNAMYRVVKTGVAAGYHTFKEFAANLLQSIGSERFARIQNTLHEAWNAEAAQNPQMTAAGDLLDEIRDLPFVAPQQVRPRPDLANPGGPEARAARNTADSLIANDGRPYDTKAAAQQGRETVRSDPDAGHARLSAMQSINSPVDVEVAKAAVEALAQRATASGDVAANERAIGAAIRYRQLGRKASLALGQFRSFSDDPEQRRQSAVSGFREAIIQPAPRLARQIERAEQIREQAVQQKAAAQSESARQREQAVIDKMDEAIRIGVQRAAQESVSIQERLTKAGVPINDEAWIANNPVQAAQVVDQVRTMKSDHLDMAYEYWINNLLTLGSTTAAVGGSIVAFAPQQLLVKPIQATLNVALNDPSGARFPEFRDMMSAAFNGTVSAMRNMVNVKAWGDSTFARAWRTEQNVFDIEHNAEAVDRYGNIPKAIPGKLGFFLRQPGNILRAADQQIKAFMSSLTVAAYARRNGIANGLTDQGLADYMHAEVQNPQSKAWQDAAHEANWASLNLGLDPFTAWLQRMRTISGLPDQGPLKDFAYRVVNAAASFLFPFARVGGAAIRVGVGDLSVFNAVTAANAVMRAAQIGRRDGVSLPLARAIVAGGLVWMFLSMYDPDDPFITGTVAVKRKGRRDLAYRTFPPYTLRIGPWTLDYSRLDPLATGLALSVDVLRGFHEGGSATAASEAMSSLGRQVMDKTFFQGISDVIRAVQADRPGEAVGAGLINFAASWIPFGWFRNAAMNIENDIMLRDVPGNPRTNPDYWETALARVLQRSQLPDLLGELPEYPQYDIWGDKKQRQDADTGFMWRMLSPVRVKPTPPAGYRDQIFIGDRILLDFNSTPDRVADPGKQVYPAEATRDFEKPDGSKGYMGDEQFSEYQRVAGQVARRALEKINPKEVPDAAPFVTATVLRSRQHVRDAMYGYFMGRPKPTLNVEGMSDQVMVEAINAAVSGLDADPQFRIFMDAAAAEAAVNQAVRRIEQSARTLESIQK